MNRRRQRGFTLIELMVALVVSALLVGMILAIFSRMSLAYRGQQQIAGVQQVLAAARATIELDAKQAGLAMSQGFKIAGDQLPPPSLPVLRSPVRVVNSATGPDQLFFYYADPSAQAVVTAVVGTWADSPVVTIDPIVGFAPGDLVVLSTADPSMPPVTPSINPEDANIVLHDACVMRIAAVDAVGATSGNITFETIRPWGLSDSRHCTPPVPMPPPPPPATNQPTMVYKFIAHGYRIDPDPARAAIGPLQGSLVSGGLLGTAADNWTDLAYGFTDIQTALRGYNTSPVDADGDGDIARNWVSGGSPDLGTNTPPIPPAASLLRMSISLVARTDRDVEGIATAATPQLIDPLLPNNNTFGDHPSVPLPSPTDPALQGSQIYRSTTFQVDFRNLGVGR